jgi:hypothetical protein
LDSISTPQAEQNGMTFPRNSLPQKPGPQTSGVCPQTSIASPSVLARSKATRICCLQTSAMKQNPRAKSWSFGMTTPDLSRQVRSLMS